MSVTKVTLRKECLKTLQSLSSHNRRYRDAKLMAKLLSHPKVKSAKSVLAFWPLGMEPDIRKATATLRRQKKVYLPFMENDSFKMVPFRLPLTQKKFGIYEPGNTNLKIKKIDVAIVPAVGVDGEGRRIGFGKGMYDRFFARLKQKPYLIFVQSKLCNTSKYICDKYDIKADLLITPQAYYAAAKGTKNDKRNTLRRWHSHS
ncbi:MAG: 5-formyltetrahydrofolate cyclo-ligase [Thiovulaceae bacterium]|nr:5-formyltetrahydrofolate cyclo-ligase [Sulfurimonadaceae bacterium]